MAAHLLVLYPPPKDPETFDRAYREEHLPYAGPRLAGATGVTTRRVVNAAAPSPWHLISDVSFPTMEVADLRRLERRPRGPGACRRDQLRRRPDGRHGRRRLRTPP